MSIFKELLRSTMLRMGYRITRRRPENRFAAMGETLLMMRGLGYQPRVVIDGGANMGQWLRIALSIFPMARFHVIEPQTACAPVLQRLITTMPNLTFHGTAITEPGIRSVRMIGIGPEGGCSGGFVAQSAEASNGQGETNCIATTLDDLLGDAIERDDRALLKLDLENHEIPALIGASKLLSSVEVIVTELQFFQINNNARPVFADFVKFLDARNFELYDFACLSPRPRDQRLRQGDVIFVRRDSPLLTDRGWE